MDKRWPERVIAMQRNWLGRSRGAKIRFPIAQESKDSSPSESLEVFTSRPDTLFGVQYLCVSATHELVKHHARRDPKLREFIENLPSLPPNTKRGYMIRGVRAQNPLSRLVDLPGFVQDPIPIYVSSYVIDSYGQGAVMGVPGHDSRDWAFWSENVIERWGPIQQVLAVKSTGLEGVESGLPPQPSTSPDILNDSCGRFAGLSTAVASEKIVSELNSAGELAQPAETWRLRDWLISRQRYWGTPIPIIHCQSCGAVPVPASELPVELPKLDQKWFQKKSGNALEQVEDWINVSCPSCGGAARRETDTMDTFACSSWYMFRFVDPLNEQVPFTPERANSSMPADIYVGGIEHAILHLLYARFMSKFIASTEMWPGGNDPTIRGEPFRQLLSQGMVHGKTYSHPQDGRFLKPEELDMMDPLNPKIKATGTSPIISFEKMSKSKYNGVDPSAFVDKYGADVTRAHILFQAPVSEVLEWEEERIIGIQRWLYRTWRFVTQATQRISSSYHDHTQVPFPQRLGPEQFPLYSTLFHTISSVSASLSHTYALNTCISDLMSLTNVLTNSPRSTFSTPLLYHSTSTLLRLLAPFVPAFAEEGWEILHGNLPRPKSTMTELPSDALDSIFHHAFPSAADWAVDSTAVKGKRTCVVMEDGKKRFAIDIEHAPQGMKGKELEEWVLCQVRGSEAGERWLIRKGGSWRRVVIVGAGKTVNFVGWEGEA